MWNCGEIEENSTVWNMWQTSQFYNGIQCGEKFIDSNNNMVLSLSKLFLYIMSFSITYIYMGISVHTQLQIMVYKCDLMLEKQSNCTSDGHCQ